MQCTHVSALKDLAGHHLGVSGEELDNAWRKASFEHDVVEQPAGVNRTRARFPDDNVSDYERSDDQVDRQGREVERSDGVDETIQGTDLRAAIAHLSQPRWFFYTRAQGG